MVENWQLSCKGYLFADKSSKIGLIVAQELVVNRGVDVERGTYLLHYVLEGDRVVGKPAVTLSYCRAEDIAGTTDVERREGLARAVERHERKGRLTKTEVVEVLRDIDTGSSIGNVVVVDGIAAIEKAKVEVELLAGRAGRALDRVNDHGHHL